MSIFKKIFSVVILSAFLGVVLHVHPADAGELHAAHQACAVCALAARAGGPSFYLPAAECLRRVEPVFFVLHLFSQPLVNFEKVLTFLSRAPPKP